MEVVAAVEKGSFAPSDLCSNPGAVAHCALYSVLGSVIPREYNCVATCTCMGNDQWRYYERALNSKAKDTIGFF